MYATEGSRIEISVASGVNTAIRAILYNAIRRKRRANFIGGIVSIEFEVVTRFMPYILPKSRFTYGCTRLVLMFILYVFCTLLGADNVYKMLY